MVFMECCFNIGITGRKLIQSSSKFSVALGTWYELMQGQSCIKLLGNDIE